MKIKTRIKKRINKKFKQNEVEKLRIENLPRFTETEIEFLNKSIRIVDIASFLFMKKEIFEQEIYKFNSISDEPYIIDCGANIGLSIIYFKQLFPKAVVIGFEPDDKIFNVLQHNLEAYHVFNVELIKKACWNEETTLQFYSEGADGGRFAREFDQQNIIEVQTLSLKNYLNRKVDFLKIDIEGAETEVMEDIKDLLDNVERIFVEFHSFVGKEQMLPEILNILKRAGFRLHITSPGLISKSPFTQLSSSSNMDNQLNIYGIR